MLDDISAKLTLMMVNKGVVLEEDTEIYNYSWAITLSTFGTFAIILLISIFLGEFVGTVLYLLSFTTLRVFAGGYHADTYFKCFLITIFYYVCAVSLRFFFPAEYITMIIPIFLILSIIITFCFAPISHPNKLYTNSEYEKNKKISRQIISIESLIIVLLLILRAELNYYLLWVSTGIALTSLSLFYVIKFPYKFN